MTAAAQHEPKPRRKPGPAPKPKPPKVRKRKPRSETIVGQSRIKGLIELATEGGAPTSVIETEDAGRGLPGRPTKFRDEYIAIAQKMCSLGAVDADLAEAFSVDITTIWHWQTRYPKFAAALEVGKGPADERVVRAFYQRAVGYTYDAMKIMQYEGAPVKVPYREHVPPDINAIKTWLSNRRGEDWKIDTRTIEHTGANGRTLAEELGKSPEALMETARWIAERLAAAGAVELKAIDITPPATTKAPSDDDDT